MIKVPEIRKKHLAYLGLIFVILVWGIQPQITLHFYTYYSPTIRIAFNSMLSAAALLILSRKKLCLLTNSTYLKLGISTGFFMALANILQKIGLQYTSPANYAFLENLSVLTVPIMMYFFIRKKPSILTVSAAILCLLSSFLLAGNPGSEDRASLLGDILCALAGLLYGVNIAATAAFGRKLNVPLYLMIQMFTETVVSFAASILFHITQVEAIRFHLQWQQLLTNAVIVFISSTLCWIIRTNAMKHVDAAAVAIMMPFSSVVTAIISVVSGVDKLTGNLVVGILLGMTAIILSGISDKKAYPRKNRISKCNNL